MRERNYNIVGNFSTVSEEIGNPAYWEDSPIDVQVKPVVYRKTVEFNNEAVASQTGHTVAEATLFSSLLSVTVLLLTFGL